MTQMTQMTQMTEMDTRTLPGRYYHDPAIYAQEQACIFGRLWTCVGRTDRLREPGAYILCDLGGENVIVLRDREGQLRAFLNLCRHRGARICTVEQGQLNATLQCRYHAWTYALDGHLAGAPNSRKDPAFDPARFGLLPVSLHEWEGLIWLNLGANPLPLATQLGVLYTRFAHYHVGELACAATITYEVRANWKLVVENSASAITARPSILS
jgi:Rieske 2Fe-2S family protein